VARAASPLTPHINRPRKDVISYTIQAGDTMFGIAQQFNLQPESILWANPELKDNPDLLSVGMEIAVPPVDGVLHTVQKGDTLDSVAKKYKVAPEAITAAIWNNLIPGQDLPIGMSIIVPGGRREMVVWQIPAANKPAPAGTGAGGWSNAGQCLNVSAKVAGTGKFVWPANVHRVSGNPYAWWHRGIDLAGNKGDPVYAADTGTVLWAGPNSWGYGNMILIDHGNGWQTLYAHLSQIACPLRSAIGSRCDGRAIGSTGRSAGHFCILRLASTATCSTAQRPPNPWILMSCHLSSLPGRSETLSQPARHTRLAEVVFCSVPRKSLRERHLADLALHGAIWWCWPV
jgi:LysM repeat protein